MGNLVVGGGDGSSPLAMVAVATHYMESFTKSHVLKLRHECSKLSMKNSLNGERTYFISRNSFREALSRTFDDETPVVVEILQLIFVMQDDDCRNRVNYRNYCCGISPLACKKDDDLPTVLKFCLRVIDDKDTGFIEPRHLTAVLHSKFSRAEIFSNLFYLKPIFSKSE